MVCVVQPKHHISYFVEEKSHFAIEACGVVASCSGKSNVAKNQSGTYFQFAKSLLSTLYHLLPKTFVVMCLCTCGHIDYLLFNNEPEDECACS